MINDKSQHCMVTHLRCGGIFYDHFSANLLLSCPVKDFWKLVKVWQSICGCGGIFNYYRVPGVFLFWNTL